MELVALNDVYYRFGNSLSANHESILALAMKQLFQNPIHHFSEFGSIEEFDFNTQTSKTLKPVH